MTMDIQSNFKRLKNLIEYLIIKEHYDFHLKKRIKLLKMKAENYQGKLDEKTLIILYDLWSNEYQWVLKKKEEMGELIDDSEKIINYSNKIQ